jgi:amino-acid N-acetyltransferase
VTAEIRPARAAELPAVLRLLADAGLPGDGVADHFPHAFLVADGAGALDGLIGVEVYGDAGLLRSAVVRPERRGTGLGQRLARAAVDWARERGVRHLFLLTTTAEEFFPRIGFERVERTELPDSLGASAELRGACPATAVAMRLPLAG